MPEQPVPFDALRLAPYSSARIQVYLTLQDARSCTSLARVFFHTAVQYRRYETLTPRRDVQPLWYTDPYPVEDTSWHKTQYEDDMYGKKRRAASEAAAAKLKDDIRAWEAKKANRNAVDKLRCLAEDHRMICRRLPVLFSALRISSPPLPEPPQPLDAEHNAHEVAQRECIRFADYFQAIANQVFLQAIARQEIPPEWPTEIAPPNYPIRDLAEFIRYLNTRLDNWLEESEEPDLDMFEQEKAEELWQRWIEQVGEKLDELRYELEWLCQIAVDITGKWGVALDGDLARPESGSTDRRFAEVVHRLREQQVDAELDQYLKGSDEVRAQLMGRPTAENTSRGNKKERRKSTDIKIQKMVDHIVEMKRATAAELGEIFEKSERVGASTVHNHYAPSFPSFIKGDAKGYCLDEQEYARYRASSQK